MDRLTNRVNGVVTYTKGPYPDTTAGEMCGGDIRNCLALLADYEDLGYTPKELLLIIGRLEGIEMERAASVALKEKANIEGEYLNPAGKYAVEFAANHGLPIAEAMEQPMVKARFEVFYATGY